MRGRTACLVAAAALLHCHRSAGIHAEGEPVAEPVTVFDASQAVSPPVPDAGNHPAERFERESRDDAWAAPREQLLRRVAASIAGTFPDATVDIECRASTCRVLVTLTAVTVSHRDRYWRGFQHLPWGDSLQIGATFDKYRYMDQIQMHTAYESHMADLAVHEYWLERALSANLKVQLIPPQI